MPPATLRAWPWDFPDGGLERGPRPIRTEDPLTVGRRRAFGGCLGVLWDPVEGVSATRSRRRSDELFRATGLDCRSGVMRYLEPAGRCRGARCSRPQP